MQHAAGLLKNSRELILMMFDRQQWLRIGTKKVISSREDVVISPWVTLVAKTMSSQWHTANSVYHSLKQADYISILAITSDGRIPLVKQYRPALEKVTLELPGGLLEKGEEPAAAVARELQEETGFQVTGVVELIGHLAPDTGRLENRLWCYFARDVVAGDTGSFRPDPGVECVIYSPAELFEAVEDGSFEHALHIAILGLAFMKGHLPAPRRIS